MPWILVPDCPHSTVEETAAIVAAALHTRPPLPPKAPPKAPHKAPAPPLPPNKAPPKTPPYPTVLAPPKAPHVPKQSPPTLSPAASARDEGMAWPGGYIRYGVDENGRLEYIEPPHLALSYIVDGEYHPPLPGDDPHCLYHWCRVAIPDYSYIDYHRTLTRSPMKSRQGWFVACIPRDEDCNICGEAWSRHGIRCDEAMKRDVERQRARWHEGRGVNGWNPSDDSDEECAPVPPDEEC